MAAKVRIAVATALVAALAPLAVPAPAAAAPTLDREVVVSGLDRPWDMGFLSDGTMFFTERSGQISVRLPGGTINSIVDPVDVIYQGGEGGMLGLAVDPVFDANPSTTANRYIYACYSSNLDGDDAGPTDNRLVRFEINATLDGVAASTPIVTGIPHNKGANGRHSGCRPRFKPGSSPPALFVGTGDAAFGTVPQDPSSLGGKVLRVRRNGNPYPGNKSLTNNLDDRIFTYGHRNVQGIAFDSVTNKPYSMEHGPDRNDELNKLRNGRNYGWDPVPGYNETVPMTDRQKFPDAIKAVWRSGFPTIAPSGITFLDGPQWRGWDDEVVAAILKDMELRVFFFNAKRTKIKREKGFDEIDGVGTPRLRSVVQGPDGNLYIATDVGGTGGEIWKVTPT